MSHGASGQSESDATLLERAARSDERAFEVLYRRFESRIFRYVAALTKDTAVAEELTSETFFEVWRGAATFRGASSVSTWIFGIARHKTFSLLRQRKPPAESIDGAGPIPAEDAGPEEIAATGALQHKVRRALERLSPEHREALELSLYHDLSYEEIARIAGCPVNTVKTRAYYARREMKKILTKMGIDAPV